jgi:UDP-N-acetylmuramate: L-alanyl-gamma-D-glutamyl-meso-diaminopimelate ligase
MRIHFIAVGGAVMHNMAISMHNKGFIVTGSDDEIFEPAKSRLEKYGLLPGKMGWDENKITAELDAVIVGMHARLDNPELIKAKDSGIKIYSFPEYIYEQSKNKKRIVIGGSHGKTTITAMIMHVLKQLGKDFDYMVGSMLEGFDTMVKLTDSAPLIILEGDEYLTSPIDTRPKFHLYMPDVALISGIAWDHINVFPKYELYKDQFRIFGNLVSDGGALIYYGADKDLCEIVDDVKYSIRKLPYLVPDYIIENGVSFILDGDKKVELKVFGRHNLANINGARLVCNEIGIKDKDFYIAISTFPGAAKRLEIVKNNDKTAVYKDFAHSPSKLKATTEAAKEQYPERKLVACMELHTFSSLNKNFLQQYNGAMDKADEAFVYYNPSTLEHKKLDFISEAEIKDSFGNQNIKVFTDSTILLNELMSRKWENANLLMMSSGNFGGIDFIKLADNIIS